MENKEKAKIVRAACTKAYNMPYTEFLKQRGLEDGGYAKEKFALMQKDFAKYFCSLDLSNATAFMKDI